jgi:hypothetical protein
MTDSVRVVHRDTPRIYPRCLHVDSRGACMVGSTYLVPTGNPQHPGTWKWMPLCTLHFNEWHGNIGRSYPNDPAFRISPLIPPRRAPGSVPRTTDA